MKVLSGSSSEKLAKALSGELGCGMVRSEKKRFPDDECYVRIDENLDGREIVLVCNSYPDTNIIELFLLQDAINNLKIRKLTTVIPYFGYARQDKLFKPGEVVSAMSMARRIGAGTDEVILVDIHERKIADWFGAPARMVSAMGDIGQYLGQKSVDLIISPDEGALELVGIAAEAANVEYDHIVKHRLNADTVVMELKSLNVKGRCIGIVDDMISTGGTIMKAADNIYSQGAERVYAACTHGLFSGGSLELLQKRIDGIYTSDTIENPCSVLSVASAIAEELDHSN